MRSAGSVVHSGSQRTLRKNACRERKALVDRRRIGHETIKRNKGGNGGKYCEQPIEDDPSCDGQQAIFVHLLIHSPENSAPVGPKEEPGRTGLMRSACGRVAGNGQAPGSNAIPRQRRANGSRHGTVIQVAFRAHQCHYSQPRQSDQYPELLSCMSSPIRFGALRRPFNVVL